jgi:hypothetical protein
MSKRILTVCGVLALAATSAFADIGYIGQNNGTVIPPLQGWTGPLGMDFDVNTAITITYMGVYNAFALTKPELASTLEVAIFNISGTMVAGTDTTFKASTAYTQLSGDVYDLFQSITPVTLGPGDYSVVAVGFNGNQPNGNQGFTDGVGASEGITNGSISYVGTARFDYSGGGLHLPLVIDGGPPNRYDAGTFAVPEAGFYSIFTVFALALTALGITRRRKNA